PWHTSSRGLDDLHPQRRDRCGRTRWHWRGTVAGQAGQRSSSPNAKANRQAASKDLQASMRQTADNPVVSIKAQKQRADVATKRRIYAACLAAFQQVMRAAVNYRTARTTQTEEERKPLIQKQEDAQDKMYQTMGELILIAPYDIAQLTDLLSKTLLSF